MSANRARHESRADRLRPPRHLSDEWLHAGPLAAEAQAAAGSPGHEARARGGQAGGAPGPTRWRRALGAALILALVGSAAWRPETPVGPPRKRPPCACPRAQGAPADGRVNTSKALTSRSWEFSARFCETVHRLV
jgi:hypothetical protein